MEILKVDVCVVGGGPAGLTLGLELARRGCEVVVVEQSSHYDRSFRGESISPDAVLLLDQLGLLGEIVAAGALVTRHMEISENGRVVLRTDFDDFKYPYRHPMEVPQPTLLGALERAARERVNFRLFRRTSVIGLVEEGGHVVGARCTGGAGEWEIRAQLTVGADGRYSKVLAMSELPYRRMPLERDVIWLRLPLPEDWDAATYRIRIKGDRHGLFIPTHPHFVRVGFNIPKDGLKEIRKAGMPALYARLDELAPELFDLVREHVKDWSHTALLDIFTSVVPQWSRPGLALIGDAAHTLSPILGQGVNHALVDATTLAGLVFSALRQRNPARALKLATAQFQRIREPDVRRSRSLQLRQERMFTFSCPPAVLLRGTTYRAMNRSSLLRNHILSDVYFPIQKRSGRR